MNSRQNLYNRNYYNKEKEHVFMLLDEAGKPLNIQLPTATRRPSELKSNSKTLINKIRKIRFSLSLLHNLPYRPDDSSPWYNYKEDIAAWPFSGLMLSFRS